MKKKFSIIITALLVTLNLVGCGTNQNATKVKNKVQNAPQQAKNDVITIPKDLNADMGTGTFYISTASGTSKNGATPIVNKKSNDTVERIQLNTTDFSAKNSSYIFVDGILNTKQQLSNSKSNIDIKDSALKQGKHRIDIVQFNNNKTTDKVLTHKSAYYEVRS
ncbi:hypothetical protein GTH52_11940 [Clostridium tyrobutyricum]|mgnify:CR=1 FL=1|jgi:PBP1b-binding outer membrane lipoprotein LpoB|uniref:Lipoprotein, putative n=1 Tax=Clostridium tyrobutyricum DIVETGP TaxID=1408889 RepID=W6N6F3_CLOTY|nr:hypothetical protein [Clostridium tyrobutyricum]AND83289.1 hypothetical protein CTK_C00190 [Clostridium tyrobutyricum]ANP70804.1 hypothetical protein BA182_14425 [Clostridium tyrobutyricum]MBR9648284.1 hypothetical protein [Clostridium tyrobutyricum]MBV4417047.1 hypothetical protein [Clostridium tyrobutyricum]MBV4423189.1 hypothetical protein [Clostridium tyrobutyricum]